MTDAFFSVIRFFLARKRLEKLNIVHFRCNGYVNVRAKKAALENNRKVLNIFISISSPMLGIKMRMVSVLPKFVVKDQRELSMSNPKFSKSSDILSDGSANNILRPWYLFLDNMRVHNEIILSFFLVWWTVKTNWWRSQFYFYSIVRTSRGTYSVSITYFSFWHDLNLRPMEHNILYC